MSITPGPWRVSNQQYLKWPDKIIEGDNNFCAYVAVVFTKDDEAKSEANARLIAAAPELLAAAKFASACITSKLAEETRWKAYEELISAITKAERGEA